MTYESGTLEPDVVRGMFDRIAPVYDLMNHVMTAGLDRRWRRLAASEVVWPGDRVLDSCCGTGDLAVEDERRGGRVVGSTSRSAMLERARKKSGAIEWVQADALALPFEDAASMRPRWASACATSPTSKAVCTSSPACCAREAGSPCSRSRGRKGPLKPFFRLWFDVLVPFAGRVLPGGKAYTYLPASVRRFPGPDDLSTLARARRLRRRALPAPRGRQRRPARGDSSVNADAVLHEASPYLVELEERLVAAVDRYPGLVAAVGRNAIAAGGKRMRPLLVHLTAPDRETALRGGVAVELAHVATLVHDDVIDGAELRRGRSSAWQEHGEGAARAGGDYLFSRAFAELASAGDIDGVGVLARACLALARGEAMQKRQEHDPETPIDAYLDRIALKTGKLFEAACLLGSRDERLGEFGLALGIAFQIADDILDCVGDTIETGKIAGADLREGVPTLPLLLASREDPVVRDALEGGSTEGVLVRVAATSALQRSREVALDYARKARGLLRDEPELEALTHIVIDRER